LESLEKDKQAQPSTVGNRPEPTSYFLSARTPGVEATVSRPQFRPVVAHRFPPPPCFTCRPPPHVCRLIPMPPLSSSATHRRGKSSFPLLLRSKPARAPVRCRSSALLVKRRAPPPLGALPLQREHHRSSRSRVSPPTPKC
jgi:hypothetical protein